MGEFSIKNGTDSDTVFKTAYKVLGKQTEKSTAGLKYY